MNQHAPRYFALVPAAGVGSRMGAASPKQYLALGGKPMLRHTLDAFVSSPLIAHTYVIVSVDDGYIEEVVPPDGVTVLRCGGASRFESVRNGMRQLENVLAATDWVLVHDAARPGLSPALIEKLITETGDHPVGGMLALPVVDTVKRMINDEVATVSRDALWLAQTPQMFRWRLLADALEAVTDPNTITDEASAVEALGLSPRLVPGHPRNLKVTLPDDVRIAEMYLAAP